MREQQHMPRLNMGLSLVQDFGVVMCSLPGQFTPVPGSPPHTPGWYCGYQVHTQRMVSWAHCLSPRHAVLKLTVSSTRWWLPEGSDLDAFVIVFTVPRNSFLGWMPGKGEVAFQ